MFWNFFLLIRLYVECLSDVDREFNFFLKIKTDFRNGTYKMEDYLSNLFITADESGSGVGVCGLLLTWISWLLVLVTLPFSLCVCFKVSACF